MRAKPDLLDVVESAYRMVGTDETWLRELCTEVERATGSELGCSAFFLDASNMNRVRARPAVHSPRAPAIDIVAMFESLSPEHAARLFGGHPVNTSSAQVGRRLWRQVVAACGSNWPREVGDTLGMLALDARRVGCSICIPTREATQLTRLQKLRYARLAVHVATALRLRRNLGEGPARADLTGDGEAVLDADGSVIDARGEAAHPSARRALRAMGRARDRARTRLRREDADLALETWTALVSGRWTLLDHFDTDGRHFVVARKNPPALAAPLSLDARERMVAAAVALGHPQKLVAYELGLSRATVSRTLSSALTKLGFATPAELARALGAFAPDPIEAPVGE